MFLSKSKKKRTYTPFYPIYEIFFNGLWKLGICLTCFTNSGSIRALHYVIGNWDRSSLFQGSKVGKEIELNAFDIHLIQDKFTCQTLISEVLKWPEISNLDSQHRPFSRPLMTSHGICVISWQFSMASDSNQIRNGHKWFRRIPDNDIFSTEPVIYHWYYCLLFNIY